VAAAIGLASVFLPWIDGATGSRIGLTQPDGWLTLLIGAVATILAWYEIRAGWIAAGFLTVLVGRNILVLAQAESAAPGFGLWVGAVAFGVSAVFQFVGLATRHRSTVAGDDS
jgi:hypothetical protein